MLVNVLPAFSELFLKLYLLVRHNLSLSIHDLLSFIFALDLSHFRIEIFKYHSGLVFVHFFDRFEGPRSFHYICLFLKLLIFHNDHDFSTPMTHIFQEGLDDFVSHHSLSLLRCKKAYLHLMI